MQSLFPKGPTVYAPATLHMSHGQGEEPTSFDSAGLSSKEKLQIDSERQGLLITNRGFTHNRVLSVKACYNS